MLFRYGPIKIMITYEKLDDYSLDLNHFGTMPGIYSNENLLKNVFDKISELKSNLDKGLNQLLKNAIEFNEFCKISTEEMLPAMLGAADY